MAAQTARRWGSALLRPQNLQRRKASSGHDKGWFSEGTQEKADGVLFGETPLKPGEKRKWESWEATWYGTMGGGLLLLVVGLNAKPDTTVTTWAHKEAEKELVAEGLVKPAPLRQ